MMKDKACKFKCAQTRFENGVTPLVSFTWSQMYALRQLTKKKVAIYDYAKSYIYHLIMDELLLDVKNLTLKMSVLNCVLFILIQTLVNSQTRRLTVKSFNGQIK